MEKNDGGFVTKIFNEKGEFDLRLSLRIYLMVHSPITILDATTFARLTTKDCGPTLEPETIIQSLIAIQAVYADMMIEYLMRNPAQQGDNNDVDITHGV